MNAIAACRLGLSVSRTCCRLPALAVQKSSSSVQRPFVRTRVGCIRGCTVAATEAPALVSTANATPAVRLNLLDVLRERGLVDAVTSENLREASQQPMKVYVGFDPTADSLHLGNLLGIVALAWALSCGHTAVALLGGATARVGDPSGKSVERPVLSEAEIGRNTEGIAGVVEGILRRHAEQQQQQHLGKDNESAPSASISDRLLIVNNYDWWRDVSLLAFLRDVGKHARVGAMTSKESVRKRLASDEGMSFTEFTYQLLQGYDFVHLHNSMGVTLQMGGSDQWGNITAGTDLLRRLSAASSSSPTTTTSGGVSEGNDAAGSSSEMGELSSSSSSPSSSPPVVYGLTWPLLLKSDGSKFGKSEGGAIWLSASLLSPYKFYQYLFATPDSDVIRFLRILTFLDGSMIDNMAAAMQQPNYEPNAAQKLLAAEVTRFVHGQEGVDEALRATAALAPGGSTRLDVASLEAIAGDVPSCQLARASLVGRPIADVMAEVGLSASKGAARRLLKQGGVYLNNEKVGEEGRIVEEGDVVGGKMLLLAAGKKNKMIVRLE